MKDVSSTRNIDVPASQLWQGITSEQHLEACHPYIQRHSKSAKKSAIADEITYLNNVVFTRESTSWMEGQGYDLLVGKASEPKNEVQWRITPVNETSCQLTIAVTPRAIEKLPKVIRNLALTLFVRRQVALYLDAVTSGIKSWMESGAPVDKTAYKKHRWFCP
tara:strand:- start:524 stop:1012 length:489 start_codon:yes stop_codon:yes gene_type:complete